MWLLILEALAALALLGFAVWWTMFSGRRREPEEQPEEQPEELPEEPPEEQVEQTDHERPKP